MRTTGIMVDTILIGLCGRREVGKSSVAKFIKDFEPNTRVLPFAEQLKTLAMQLGWNGIKDEKGVYILQHLGTDVCRTIDTDYWIKKWKQAYVMAVELGYKVIISDDVRFLNEAQTILDQGGVLVKLYGHVGETVTTDQLKHVSESGIPDEMCNMSMDTCCSFDDLRDRTRALFHNILRMRGQY